MNKQQNLYRDQIIKIKFKSKKKYSSTHEILYGIIYLHFSINDTENKKENFLKLLVYCNITKDLNDSFLADMRNNL